MKIIATSDWHLGNMFHGNDRLPEHRHFMQWLLQQITEQQPDALLVAGDVFDNGNPSAAAQSAYYKFLADATQCCPTMQIVITAGNHDSANRLEAPRELLSRHKVEIRGNVPRRWTETDGKGAWQFDYDDLIIPITSSSQEQLVILAVPYLRTDTMQNGNYAQGVAQFLREITARARQQYPDTPLLMMAHMYASGAYIPKDSSEKIVIGGLEEVRIDHWDDRPDYLTCGHIHKQQSIWNTDWARYTGSVLPMSFAEKDYVHSIDLIEVAADRQVTVSQLVYEPQHRLRVLPDDDSGLSPAQIKKLIRKELPELPADGKRDEHAVYVTLKVKLGNANNEDLKSLEDAVSARNAILCRIQKCMAQLNVTSIDGERHITSIEDILNRDPMESIKECYQVSNGQELTEHQTSMLAQMLSEIKEENND